MSNEVAMLTNYQSKIEKYRDMPLDIDIKLPSLKIDVVQEGELSLELENYRATLDHVSFSGLADGAGIISHRELVDKAREITIIPTDINPLYHIACVGADEVWAGGQNKTIKLLDGVWAERDTVTTTCQYWPNDITVTRHGELEYSDGSRRTVNIVKEEGSETPIITPQGWHPGKIWYTKSGDILVSMCTADFSQRKIVRYQGHTMKQEIDKKEDGKPIYEGGKFSLYITENKNEDSCTSNGKAGALIVVNKSGKVRFRYTGTPVSRKKPFIPTHIATDTMCQIIVADYVNACLHILDQSGQFLRCVDNCGLEGHSKLSGDSEGRLWVGLYHSGEMKVIQYMK
jgi:hypothetical protein